MTWAEPDRRWSGNIAEHATQLMGLGKLMSDDFHRRPMKTRRTPAKIFLQVTFDAGVEERKHYAHDTGVRVETAHRHPRDPAHLQLPKVRRLESVGGFLEDQIVRLRHQQKIAVRSSRETAALFQDPAEHRFRWIDELRENPAGKTASVARHLLDVRRRRVERTLDVDDHDGEMALHAAWTRPSRSRSGLRRQGNPVAGSGLFPHCARGFNRDADLGVSLMRDAHNFSQLARGERQPEPRVAFPHYPLDDRIRIPR